MAEKHETINAKVPPEMRREIRVKAAKEDKSMSAWVREALEERLEKEDSDREAPADD